MNAILSLLLVYEVTQATVSGNIQHNNVQGKQGKIQTQLSKTYCHLYFVSEGSQLPRKYICQGPCKMMKVQQGIEDGRIMKVIIK